MFNFIIPIPPKTKKNSQRIIYCGGRPRIIQSKEYLEYEESCFRFLQPLNIDYPINLKTVFYVPTMRRVDLSNLISACHDVLVKYKVIQDDNFRIVQSVDGSTVLYDKFNPRTEIEITQK